MNTRIGLIAVALLVPTLTLAQPSRGPALELLRVQSHAGQMDTDGLLSYGELKNPNIDYDRAQRMAKRRGDIRFDNPYNDSAAKADRIVKNDMHAQYDWQRWDRNRRSREDYEWERDRRWWDD